MPDGSLLTAFGTGYRSQPDANGMSAPRDVGLVRWRLSNKPVNADAAMIETPYNSDQRNVFDPGLRVPFIPAME